MEKLKELTTLKPIEWKFSRKTRVKQVDFVGKAPLMI